MVSSKLKENKQKPTKPSKSTSSKPKKTASKSASKSSLKDSIFNEMLAEYTALVIAKGGEKPFKVRRNGVDLKNPNNAMNEIKIFEGLLSNDQLSKEEYDSIVDRFKAKRSKGLSPKECDELLVKFNNFINNTKAPGDVSPISIDAGLHFEINDSVNEELAEDIQAFNDMVKEVKEANAEAKAVEDVMNVLNKDVTEKVWDKKSDQEWFDKFKPEKNFHDLFQVGETLTKEQQSDLAQGVKLYERFLISKFELHNFESALSNKMKKDE